MTKLIELLNGVKNNKYTTIIGAAAIAYGAYEIFNEEGDNKWGIGLIIIGVGLLFSKDGDKDTKEEIEKDLDNKYKNMNRNMEYPNYPNGYPQDEREFEQFHRDNHQDCCDELNKIKYGK